MGIAYFTPEEILTNKKNIETGLAHSNYFVRSKEVHGAILKYVPHGGQVIEVGSGAGELAQFIVDKGYKLACVDIDNYLPPDLEKKVEFVKLDICFNPLPFKDASADALLAIAIIEHLENPLLLVREAGRVVKQGGVFIIAIPYIFSIRARLGFLFTGDVKGYTAKNNHITLHTKSVFKKLFLKDFKVREIRYSDAYVIIFSHKFRLPSFCKNWFSNKIMYVLEKV